MPLTPTHAFVPVAFAVALSQGRPNLRLIGAAVIAAALPDADAVTRHILNHLPPDDPTIWDHRGFAHSLFLALVAGAFAAAFHRWLRVPSLTAFVAVAAAMASHGLLDMMTSSGLPVAYLWPVSSVRLFADWRPIHTQEVTSTAVLLARARAEAVGLILPMFVLSLVVRLGLRAGKKRQAALS